MPVGAHKTSLKSRKKDSAQIFWPPDFGRAEAAHVDLRWMPLYWRARARLGLPLSSLELTHARPPLAATVDAVLSLLRVVDECPGALGLGRRPSPSGSNETSARSQQHTRRRMARATWQPFRRLSPSKGHRASASPRNSCNTRRSCSIGSCSTCRCRCKNRGQ